MGQTEYAATLQSLRAQQTSQPLSILTLAEPIIACTTNPTTARHSDASSSDLENPTPASLANDLAHYKELFSKLRFSYLEQVTKEKFLRSIVGDPPLLVSHADNAKLEDAVAGMKSELKGRKQEVERLVVEMEGMARALAGRWEGVKVQMTQLEVLPKQVAEMEGRIAEMQEALRQKMGEDGEQQQQQQPPAQDREPRMDLSLEETEEAVRAQLARTREVERQIAQLQRQLPAKIRECENVERELEGLERRKNEATARAREARRVREEGGRDVVEEMGRWYRAKEVVLNGLLDVEVEG